METNLEAYDVELAILIADIEANKLTWEQAQNRCKILWSLIPYNFEVNPGRLNNLLYNNFKDCPHNAFSKIFKIDVGNLNDLEIDEYVRKVAEKFKKRPVLTDWADIQTTPDYEMAEKAMNDDDAPITAFIEFLQKHYPNGISFSHEDYFFPKKM